MKRIAVALIACVVFAATAHAQNRDWMTSNADAQRSSWIRSDAKINKDSMAKPGFQFLWKLKLKNPPRQLNSSNRLIAGSLIGELLTMRRIGLPSARFSVVMRI